MATTETTQGGMRHIESQPECTYANGYAEVGVENDYPFRIEHYTYVAYGRGDSDKPYTITMHRINATVNGNLVLNTGPSSNDETCAMLVERAKQAVQQAATRCCRHAEAIAAIWTQQELQEHVRAEHRAVHERLREASLPQPKWAKKTRKIAACAAATQPPVTVRILPASVSTFDPLTCPLGCGATLHDCHCQLGRRVREAGCPPQVKGWALARAGQVERVITCRATYLVQPSSMTSTRKDWYTVTVRGAGRCNCPAKATCKHIYAAKYQAAASCLHAARATGNHAGRDGRSPTSSADLTEACRFWCAEYGTPYNHRINTMYRLLYFVAYAEGKAWKARFMAEMQEARGD